MRNKKMNQQIKSVIAVLCCAALMLAMAGCKKEEPVPAADTHSSDNYSTYVFLGSDSRATGEDWKTDTETGTPVEHVVWFDDARSIDQKLRLLEEYTLTGGSVWNIMRYFPQLWLVLNSLYTVERLE